VVAAAGALGGYGGHRRSSGRCCRPKGIVVRGDRIRDFEDCRWAPRTELSGAAGRKPTSMNDSRATRRDHGDV
jgi:hypothetical protein